MNKELIPVTKFSLKYSVSKVEFRHKIDSISSAVDILLSKIKINRLKHIEMGWVMLLNKDLEIIGMAELTKGNSFLHSNHFNEILRLALLSNSYQFIVFYNRSDGKLRPVGNEFTSIQQLQGFAKIVNTDLLDVVLFNDKTYFSMLGASLI